MGKETSLEDGWRIGGCRLMGLRWCYEGGFLRDWDQNLGLRNIINQGAT